MIAMSSHDREYIKLNVERNYIAQIKYISESASEKFEDTFNRIIFDGLLLNQTDATVKKELLKKQKLHKILIDFYEILTQPCQNNPQNTSISTVTRRFYADYSPYLLKKKFTEFDKMVITKGNEYFYYLKQDFPDEFDEFKKTVTLQHRTKPYKNLFSSMMMTNLDSFSNTIKEEGNEENDLLKKNLIKSDDMGSLSVDHWTHDLNELANNMITIPVKFREEKFQSSIEYIHKKYGFDIKYEDYFRRLLNSAIEKKKIEKR